MALRGISIKNITTVSIVPLPCRMGHLLCTHEALIQQNGLIQQDEDLPCQQIQKHLESNKLCSKRAINTSVSPFKGFKRAV